jgi:hypothetical protein
MKGGSTAPRRVRLGRWRGSEGVRARWPAAALSPPPPLLPALAGLHEMLLQSEHRTLDPEEADYFYLPVRGQRGGKGKRNPPPAILSHLPGSNDTPQPPPHPTSPGLRCLLHQSNPWVKRLPLLPRRPCGLAHTRGGKHVSAGPSPRPCRPVGPLRVPRVRRAACWRRPSPACRRRPSPACPRRFIEVFHWVRSHYPYWDRNGGRDHIVVRRCAADRCRCTSGALDGDAGQRVLGGEGRSCCSATARCSLRRIQRAPQPRRCRRMTRAPAGFPPCCAPPSSSATGAAPSSRTSAAPGALPPAGMRAACCAGGTAGRPLPAATARAYCPRPPALPLGDAPPPHQQLLARQLHRQLAPRRVSAGGPRGQAGRLPLLRPQEGGRARVAALMAGARGVAACCCLPTSPKVIQASTPHHMRPPPPSRTW